MAPTLSIGIPAYNRPASLERAVRSALAQTLEDIEVVISDDASPDGRVTAVGERLMAEDARVRFVSQPENLGHARNYRWVVEAARGEHFMWLADDDWLDPDYARRCVDTLSDRSDCRLVCGQARYYGEDGGWIADERPIDLVSARPGARVATYYRLVSLNGPLFGVARRDHLLAAPFQEVPGGDWLLVGEMAAQGQVRTLRDVHIHRSMDGLSSDEERLARSFGFSGWLAPWYHVWLAGKVWREVAHGTSWTTSARLTTATISALVLLIRFPAIRLLRLAGLGRVEEWVVAWHRRRRET